MDLIDRIVRESEECLREHLTGLFDETVVIEEVKSEREILRDNTREIARVLLSWIVTRNNAHSYKVTTDIKKNKIEIYQLSRIVK